MQVTSRASHLGKLVCAAALSGLALLTFAAGWVSAQAPVPPMPAEPWPQATTTHEQMHQMMDARHGEAISERMHEAMGEDAERMMDQCVAMMNMMGAMEGMMGHDGMPSMMSQRGGAAMSDMMRRMMGR